MLATRYAPGSVLVLSPCQAPFTTVAYVVQAWLADAADIPVIVLPIKVASKSSNVPLQVQVFTLALLRPVTSDSKQPLAGLPSAVCH